MEQKPAFVLRDRIIKYILTNGTVSMEAIISVAKGKGFTESEVLDALSHVHKDKRVQQMADVTGHVMYKPTVQKVTTAPTHHAWVDANYPRYEYEMPFPEIDMSYLFLKTREERDEFKALASGRPLYMIKKKKYVNA